MKRIVIIGGGIAGLTAGIFAQKNGFKSIILEKHHTLGGSVPAGIGMGTILMDVYIGWWAQRKELQFTGYGKRWAHWKM